MGPCLLGDATRRETGSGLGAHRSVTQGISESVQVPGGCGDRTDVRTEPRWTSGLGWVHVRVAVLSWLVSADPGDAGDGMRYSPLCCGVLVPVRAGAKGVVSGSCSVARRAQYRQDTRTGEESTRERRATFGRPFQGPRLSSLAHTRCVSDSCGLELDIRALSSSPRLEVCYSKI